MESNHERKHLLLKECWQGGQARDGGKGVREVSPHAALETLVKAIPLHRFSWASPEMVAIIPAFSEGGSHHNSATPQMSSNLIPPPQTECNENTLTSKVQTKLSYV